MATGTDIVLFAIVAFLMLGGALGVLLARKLVHATLLLALVLLMVAFSFLLLGNDILAAVQVLIYVGAIITLILFTIMFTYEEESVPEMEREARTRPPSIRLREGGRMGPGSGGASP